VRHLAEKLLVTARQFPPSPNVGGFRLARLLRWLVQDYGWTAVVLCDQLTETSGPPAPESIRVVRLSRQTPSRARHLLSPGHLASRLLGDPGYQLAESLAPLQMRLCREFQPTVLLSSSPPHGLHLAALVAKRRFHVPWVADLRDPWVEASKWKKEAFRARWVLRVVARLEQAIARFADKVILNTETLLETWKKKYPTAAHKFCCIPNGADFEQLLETVNRTRPASKLIPRQENGFVICHAGNIYAGRDPLPFATALHRVRARGIQVRWLQIGHVSESYLDRLRGLLSRAGLGELLPPVPYADVWGYLLASDATMAIAPGNLTMPAKIPELVAVRKPVLLLDGGNSPGRHIVERFQLGVCAKLWDSDEIATALEVLATRAHVFQTRGAWNQAMQQLDYRARAALLHECLLDTLARASV
jgi:glycosyltransferase involved in cell wall biosynthesis